MSPIPDGSAKLNPSRAMISVRTAVLAGGGAVGLFFLGVVAAQAMPGMSGGPTKDTLTFAGTLKGISGPQTLTFIFKKGVTEICMAQAKAEPDSNGAFSVELALDLAMKPNSSVPGCPGTLFDGADVTVDVKVGDQQVATNQPINPVPYARYADRVGTPDCPLGYERDTGEPGFEANSGRWLCKKGADEVVRVGRGATGFWVDRYEASLWDAPDGSGTQLDSRSFARNGQIRKEDKPVYAASRREVTPASEVTWFQAHAACLMSGKRLIGRQEWFAAVMGTEDPVAPSSGADGTCVTTGAPTMRDTGSGRKCMSRWGAEDMIGNLSEWTDEWYASAGSTNNLLGLVENWPSGYGADGTENIASWLIRGGSSADRIGGLPAAAQRGGDSNIGPQAGAFALSLYLAPSGWDRSPGFRCVIPR